MKITAMCLLIMGRKIVAEIAKDAIRLPGGPVEEEGAQDALKKMIEDQCGIVSTKPVLLFKDKTNKRAVFIAYVNSKDSTKQKSDSKLDKGSWGLHYTDVLKTEIDARYQKDEAFYAILSISMSLIKIIMDKKPPSQKSFQDKISKVAAMFEAI